MTDPVLLAQRLAMLLEGGRRVATYKLATLLALVDACAEATPAPGQDDELSISMLDLADRVIELYWPQVRTYGELGVLRQSTSTKALILVEVTALHAAALGAGARTASGLRALSPRRYDEARKRVGRTLAQQPLAALQAPTGRSQARVPFLYDDSWLHARLSNAALARRNWEIRLLPGVADGLVRLGGLLRPVIERAWVDDVARHNRMTPETELLSGFLFGAERSSLVRAAQVLRDVEGTDCFYCQQRIVGSAHVDHFLPWARIPFDGLSNLVLAHPRCNGSKSDSLAAFRHRQRWALRDRKALEQAGTELRWPADWDRGQRLAQGLYARLPAGTPLWESVGVYSLLP